MSEVAARLSEVRARIEAACRSCGRRSDTVRLVAVSKFHSVEAIRAAYAAGQRDFGENYAQELIEKAKALSDLPELRWHFIGGLQSNKAKLLAPHCHVVETLASASAAQALSERAVAAGRSVQVMLQVNVAGEQQKSGLGPAAVAELIARVRELPALELRGLMTIPKAGDPDAARTAYRALAQLARAHALPELSMGMSDDLELAIEEGSTNVRVGTAIFGLRPSSQTTPR
ncbi:MAG: YggS family pyridoxal phosphate-dependent enzyme [Myxococcales bacterium]